MNTESPRFIGIEIGGTKTQIVIGDAAASILDRRRFSVSREEGANGIRRHIEGALREFLVQTRPAAIGVGFGGPVDWQTGEICCSHHVEGWSGFNMAQWLRGLTDTVVAVDNDANVAAFGEALHGAGVNSNPVFYVTLGSGVGGGLVMDRKIYHGAKPGEAEIGHVRLHRDGTILESCCSGWAVDKRIRQAIAENKSSLLAQLVGETKGAEARFLKPALDHGCELAQRILDDTAEDLAFGLSHVVHLVHPEMIVLGGGLSLIGGPLRRAVAIHVRSFTMDAFAPGPEISLAQLREDSVPIGALALAVNAFRGA
jgi:glucokinase